jgi:hypothetical protein
MESLIEENDRLRSALKLIQFTAEPLDSLGADLIAHTAKQALAGEKVQEATPTA